MPPEDQDAKLLESSTDETDDNPSGGGHRQQKKSSEQLLREYQEESKRKSEKIKDLEGTVKELESFKEEFEEAKDRIAELQDKDSLSRSEKGELEDLEKQVRAIQEDPRSKAWLKLFDQRAETKYSERVAKDKEREVKYQVKEWADDNGIDTTDKKVMDKFESELVYFMRAVDPDAEEPVTVRSRMAYKAWKKDNETRKKFTKLQEEAEHRESGGRSVNSRQSTFEELRANRTKSDADMSRYLAAVANAQKKKAS